MPPVPAHTACGPGLRARCGKRWNEHAATAIIRCRPRTRKQPLRHVRLVREGAEGGLLAGGGALLLLAGSDEEAAREVEELTPQRRAGRPGRLRPRIGELGPEQQDERDDVDEEE